MGIFTPAKHLVLNLEDESRSLLSTLRGSECRGGELSTNRSPRNLAEKPALARPSFSLSEPYSCALPLSPHFCSWKLLPQPYPLDVSRWSKHGAHAHLLMACLSCLTLPPMMGTLVGFSFLSTAANPQPCPSTVASSDLLVPRINL